jgi:predicted transcriptional regulator
VTSELSATLFNEKPMKAIVAIRSLQDPYIKQVSEEVDCTYSHTVKLLQKLKRKGVVTSEERGRRKILRLTSQGEALSRKIVEMGEIMDQISPDRTPEKIDRPKLEENTLERPV